MELFIVLYRVIINLLPTFYFLIFKYLYSFVFLPLISLLFLFFFYLQYFYFTLNSVYLTGLSLPLWESIDLMPFALSILHFICLWELRWFVVFCPIIPASQIESNWDDDYRFYLSCLVTSRCTALTTFIVLSAERNYWFCYG